MLTLWKYTQNFFLKVNIFIMNLFSYINENIIVMPKGQYFKDNIYLLTIYIYILFCLPIIIDLKSCICFLLYRATFFLVYIYIKYIIKKLLKAYKNLNFRFKRLLDFRKTQKIIQVWGQIHTVRGELCHRFLSISIDSHWFSVLMNLFSSLRKTKCKRKNFFLFLLLFQTRQKTS